MSQQDGKATGETRRTVLRAGALAGSAALVSTIAARSYAQEDNTIKIALIGCGGRGSGAANQALSTSGPTKLVAMADAFSDRLENAHKELAGAHADKVDVADERKFVGLDAYKKAVDVLGDDPGSVAILATPPGWRPVHFEYAVSKGRHVFMEKPVATDAPGVKRVLAAAAVAKEKNLKVGVGLQRHHQAPYQECLKRVHDGEIGDILYMHVYWNDAGVWVRNRLEGMTEMEYQHLNWYYFNWLCGDHITEQHIHNLDVGNWVMNDYPIYAQGMGGRQVRTGKEYGQIFDHHAVEYVYANGARMYSYCRHIQGCQREVSEFAHGTKGSAALSGTLYTDQAMRTTGWRYRERAKDPYQVEHDVLFDAIRNNLPHNEAENGAKSTFTSILGRAATYSGQRVRWDVLLDKGEPLAPGMDAFTFASPAPVQPGPDGFYPMPKPGDTDPLKT